MALYRQIKENMGPRPESLQYLIQQRVKHTSNSICRTNFPWNQWDFSKNQFIDMIISSRSDPLISDIQSEATGEEPSSTWAGH